MGKEGRKGRGGLEEARGMGGGKNGCGGWVA